MLKRSFFLSLIITVTTASVTVQKASAQPLSFLADSVSYLWPTDASNQLSSTFAETRSAHLHAGLDIRTWGQEGYRVFATRYGVIYRIGMSPFGYGNVIYMKHGDGSYSVYAHLNRFEPKLQAFADSLRLIDYTADLDKIIFEEGFTYKKGDVIGYTGSTGVGPPHLHFELRTPEFKPFNPLLTNLTVHDNIPPVFRQLGIEYLDDETLRLKDYRIVNGTGSGSRYNFGEITVNGPVGLSVNVHDRANNTPNVYAVHTLTMMHHADTLFHSQADYFPFMYANHMFLDRSYPILVQTRRGFQRLYKVKGNRLPMYQTNSSLGLIDFDTGTYPIRIIAADANGNRSIANLTIHVNPSGKSPRDEITYIPTYPKPSNPISQANKWNNLKLDENRMLLVSASDDVIPFSRDVRYYKNESINSFEKFLVPGKRTIFKSPDNMMWIEFPENALHDTLQLRMDIVKTGTTIQFNFDPDRLPLAERIQFNYLLPDYLNENERLGLFSVDRYRDRHFFLNAMNNHGVIRGSLREISSLIIKSDNTPPWVGRPRLERNLAGNHVVILPVRDGDTGINYRNSLIKVNGMRGIIEYDPEKNFLIFYNPEFRPAPSNQIEAEVLDGAGNRTVRSFTI
ncbi:MAG: M23 family metallopeptidase [Balneolaceae bacterium]|nr:MAG: M23 family metallopeptidase [Balneolaceae bacterium]